MTTQVRRHFRGPLSNHSWAEITHCLPEAGKAYDEGAVPWFYYARGSGISLYLGRTAAFCTHADAMFYFGVLPLPPNGSRAHCGTCPNYFPRLYDRARTAGFATLQFLFHHDQSCGNMAIEIVDVRNGTLSYSNGPGSCPAGVHHSLRRGLHGSSKCECTRVHGCVSCTGDRSTPVPYPPSWALYPTPANASVLSWAGHHAPYSVLG